MSTSTNDIGSAVTLNGESVLADVDPPDVLDGAGALAVNTLSLVLEVVAKSQFVAQTQIVQGALLTLPMMRFWTVPPLATRKTASASPPSA